MSPGSAEPRYRALLDRDRALFPSDAQFEHWKRHFVSELHRGDLILELLGQYVRGFDPADLRVLDIGCGDGGVPIAFARAGARAAGLEPGLRNLERAAVRARDHGIPVDLVQGVAEALPYPAAAFDLVVLDNVLEHVEDREATLREIHRVLVPHGILYLVTPKPYAINSLIGDPHYHLPGLVLLPPAVQKRWIERRLGAGTYQVGRIPTRPWLRRALRRHGFRSLVPPRELWSRYVGDRIARPEEVRAGVMRRLAGCLNGHRGVLANPVVRWLLDVAAGSNFFITRRAG